MTLDQMRTVILSRMGVPCAEDKPNAPCIACYALRDELATFEQAIRDDCRDGRSMKP